MRRSSPLPLEGGRSGAGVMRAAFAGSRMRRRLPLHLPKPRREHPHPCGDRHEFEWEGRRPLIHHQPAQQQARAGFAQHMVGGGLQLAGDIVGVGQGSGPQGAAVGLQGLGIGVLQPRHFQ